MSRPFIRFLTSLLLAVLVSCGTLEIPFAGAVQAEDPMIVVRMRASTPCGNLCPEWIYAEGMITPETPERFRRMLRQAGTARLPVMLHSQGGDLDAALEIGRMIRAKGLATAVGSSQVPAGCSPRDKACNRGRPPALPYAGLATSSGSCAGACLFVLAAGTHRAGSWITSAQLAAPESFSTRRAGTDAATLIGVYLADMGVSAGLLARARRSALPLDSADMLHFGLSTGPERPEDLTQPGVCLGPRAAVNCVLLAAIVPAAGRLPPRPSAQSPAEKYVMHPVKRSARPRAAQAIILGGIAD